jgi:hypothetical protein
MWAVLASAQVYKWVDENGVAHFGDRPPGKEMEYESQEEIKSSPSTAPETSAVRKNSVTYDSVDYETKRKKELEALKNDVKKSYLKNANKWKSGMIEKIERSNGIVTLKDGSVWRIEGPNPDIQLLNVRPLTLIKSNETDGLLSIFGRSIKAARIR